MVLYSTERKQLLVGWLKSNYAKSYYSRLKTHKFLFFYEMLSYAKGEVSEFYSLKGYKNGPVFSNVYGDMTYSTPAFETQIDFVYESSLDNDINEDYANFAGFLVSILSEDELSDLTHEFNIWKSKESRIIGGEKNVRLDKDDIDDTDISMLEELFTAYPADYIEGHHILNVGEKYFLINKYDRAKISDKVQRTLEILAKDENLSNPVYVEIDEEGCVLVD